MSFFDNPRTIWVALIALTIAFVALTIVIYKKLRPSPSQEVTMLSYLVVPILIIGVLGLLLEFSDSIGQQGGEVEISFIVVIAVIALITLLFIVAAAFSKLNLADAKQPLGLPEGSIRAMIALMLIMVFIIFGVSIFRFTARGNEVGPTTMTVDELSKLKNVSFIGPSKAEGKYEVWVSADLPPDTMRLATQLLTTVGTLVVAVAGFYFGSSAVSSAVAAVKDNSLQPTITSISPAEGKQSTEVPITIIGRNFQMPRSVRLVRGTNDSGADARLEKAFKITP